MEPKNPVFDDEFVGLVRKEFPTEPAILVHLDKGNVSSLGFELDRARQFDGRPDRIHSMLYAGKVKQLEREAAVAMRRERLYSKWYYQYYEPMTQADQACPDTIPSPGPDVDNIPQTD